MKDDHTTNSHYITYACLFKSLGECTFELGSERVEEVTNPLSAWPGLNKDLATKQPPLRVQRAGRDFRTRRKNQRRKRIGIPSNYFTQWWRKPPSNFYSSSIVHMRHGMGVLHEGFDHGQWCAPLLVCVFLLGGGLHRRAKSSSQKQNISRCSLSSIAICEFLLCRSFHKILSNTKRNNPTHEPTNLVQHCWEAWTRKCKKRCHLSGAEDVVWVTNINNTADGCGRLIGVYRHLTFLDAGGMSEVSFSLSSFFCSLTRNITWHSMEKLAFHSLLRWTMITRQSTNSRYFTYRKSSISPPGLIPSAQFSAIGKVQYRIWICHMSLVIKLRFRLA